jgi:hypothetical protein
MDASTVIFIIFGVMIFSMIFLLGYMQLSPTVMGGGGIQSNYVILLTVGIVVGILGLIYLNTRRVARSTDK